MASSLSAVRRAAVVAVVVVATMSMSVMAAAPAPAPAQSGASSVGASIVAPVLVSLVAFVAAKMM